MTRPLFLRAVGGFAAATLAFTLASCADGGEVATDTATATVTAEETAAEEEPTDPGQGQSSQIQTADGNTVLVNPAFGEQIDQYAEDWGVPEQVQESDVGAVATFPGGNLLAHSEEGGVQPIVGMIAQTWVEDGSLTNPVGMPAAPEQENDGGSGWSQEFTNGTITWARDDAGEFTATVS